MWRRRARESVLYVVLLFFFSFPPRSLFVLRVFFRFFFCIQPTPPLQPSYSLLRLFDRETRTARISSRERTVPRIMSSGLKKPYTFTKCETYENPICLMFFFLYKKKKHRKNIRSALVVRLLCVMHWLSPLNSIPTDERCKYTVPIQNGNKLDATPGPRLAKNTSQQGIFA